MATLTEAVLAELLQAAAGEPVNLDGDGVEAPFADLGLDSLALLETGGLIERRFGVRLADEVITEAETPAELLSVVNRELAAAPAVG